MTSLTGTARLVRANLRTGRVTLVVWVGLSAALPVATFAGVSGLYATSAQRAEYAATMGGSAATQAFNGRGYDLDTIGGIGAFEVGFMGQILFPLAAILLALRFTRAQEEAGLVELVTAHRAGRLAPLAAGAITTGLAILSIGVLVAGGIAAQGISPSGAIRYAVTLVALMLFFAGVGLLAGELCQSRRAAVTLALSVLGISYLARTVVDGLGKDLTWLSPLGWFSEARPWSGQLVLWPVLALLAGGVVLFAAAVAVGRRRDLGAGVLAPRPGPGRGAPGRVGPAGWAWAATGGQVAGWAVVALVWALSLGSLAHEMTTLISANPTLLKALGLEEGTDLVGSLLGTTICALAAAAGVATILKLRDEELSGRLGLVLAGRRSRRAVWAGWLAAAGLQTVGVLALGAAGYGLGLALGSPSGPDLGVAVELVAALALPALAVVALAAAVAAVDPRIAALGWALVVWIPVVGLLGPTLRLPQWASRISPAELVGNVPVEAPSGAALLWLGIMAALLGALALTAASRRDLRAG